MLTAESVLNERYHLESLLATGGMGQVWRATDVVLRRTVAVKTLLPALVTDPGFGQRFQAEARMMAALHHPGLVDVYDYGESALPSGGSVVYLVMPCVEGEPLSDRLARGPLGIPETLSILAQAAEALHAAHTRGIIHRDVKPANLLIEADGTVRLVDFGIARALAATTIGDSHRVVGTALYMAPEQALGRSVSAATDVYSLGTVAYHALAGQPPFTGESPVEVAMRHLNDDPPTLPADIPASVRDLVGTAMAKDPADRFASAADLAAAARSIAAAIAAGADGAAGVELAAVGAGATGASNVPVAPRTARFDRATEAAEAAATPAAPAAPAAGAVAASGSTADRDPEGTRMRRALSVAATAVLLAALGAIALWSGLLGGGGATPAEPPARSVVPTDGPATRPGGAADQGRPATAPGPSAPAASSSPSPSTAPGAGPSAQTTAPPPETTEPPAATEPPPPPPTTEPGGIQLTSPPPD